MTLSTKASAFLYVEGAHDQHVIWALCQAHHISQTFDVVRPKESQQTADSWQTLLRSLEIQLMGDLADISALGVLLDADTDPMQRWQEIMATVSRVQPAYSWPTKPQIGGTILLSPDAYTPRLGVWLMPDNQAAGELEDFVSWLIPTGDELAPLAHKILDEIDEAGLKRYKKRPKAFLHTWLAWQKRPLPMGQAITEKVLLADAPLAQQFVAWLRQLFEA